MLGPGMLRQGPAAAFYGCWCHILCIETEDMMDFNHLKLDDFTLGKADSDFIFKLFIFIYLGSDKAQHLTQIFNSHLILIIWFYFNIGCILPCTRPAEHCDIALCTSSLDY